LKATDDTADKNESLLYYAIAIRGILAIFLKLSWRHQVGQQLGGAPEAAA